METEEFWVIVGIGVAVIAAFIVRMCKQSERINNLSERLTKLETIYDIEFSKRLRANRTIQPENKEDDE